MSELKRLADLGQSIWLDYIQRGLIGSSRLTRLVEEDGVRGVTSNPAIFEKAISGSDDYRGALRMFRGDSTTSAERIYETLAVEDIRLAADVLRGVYEESEARDGYVSLEVSPHLAHNTVGSVDAAQRLWREVDRPNLLIKVPATPAGIPAIEQLIAQGINVNVTLIFSRRVYRVVTEAYLSGLEKLMSRRGDLSRIASVASFFVSRIDTEVDRVLHDKIRNTSDAMARKRFQVLLGRAAIANAKMAYQDYKELVRGERWSRLAKAGANTQRLLWASTGTKDPDYSDVLYVEELIGRDTINTAPPTTLGAFRNHGRARASLEEKVDAAGEALDALSEAGISLNEICDQLLADGVRQFQEAFDRLLLTVDEGRRADQPLSVTGA